MLAAEVDHVLRQGVQRKPVQTVALVGLHDGGGALVGADEEIEVVIGAVALLAQPVAHVGEFGILRTDADAQLLGALTGQRLTGRLVLVHVAGTGDIPFAVHVAGIVAAVQQHLPLAVMLSQQQREHRRVARKML